MFNGRSIACLGMSHSSRSTAPLYVYGFVEKSSYCHACPVQLRYAFKKWGTPLGEAGKKWMKAHFPQSQTFGEAHTAQPQQPNYPPPPGLAAPDNQPFPNAWLPQPAAPPMMHFANVRPKWGVVVPPPRFGVTSPLSMTDLAVASVGGNNNSRTFGDAFGLGLMFGQQQQQTADQLHKMQEQMDVLMASHPT